MKKILLFLLIIFAICISCKKENRVYDVHIQCKASAKILDTNNIYFIRCYLNDHHIISNIAIKPNSLVSLDTTLQIYSNKGIHLFTYITTKDTIFDSELNAKKTFIEATIYTNNVLYFNEGSNNSQIIFSANSID